MIEGENTHNITEDKMEALELVEAMKAQAVKDGKSAAVNQIELAYDPAVELAVAKLKEAIPGQMDDIILDLVKVNVAPIIKASLLEMIAKA